MIYIFVLFHFLLILYARRLISRSDKIDLAIENPSLYIFNNSLYLIGQLDIDRTVIYKCAYSRPKVEDCEEHYKKNIHYISSAYHDNIIYFIGIDGGIMSLYSFDISSHRTDELVQNASAAPIIYYNNSIYSYGGYYNDVCSPNILIYNLLEKNVLTIKINDTDHCRVDGELFIFQSHLYYYGGRTINNNSSAMSDIIFISTELSTSIVSTNLPLLTKAIVTNAYNERIAVTGFYNNSESNQCCYSSHNIESSKSLYNYVPFYHYYEECSCQYLTGYLDDNILIMYSKSSEHTFDSFDINGAVDYGEEPKETIPVYTVIIICLLFVLVTIIPSILWIASYKETLLASMRQPDQTQQNQRIPASIIDQIPRRVYDPIKDGPKSACSICLDEYKEGESVMELPCTHIFHPNCVIEWFNLNIHCPLCRTNITDNV